MHLGLENKVILVSGGTKGIGRAMVKGFLAEGAIVHFCARSEKDVDAANQLHNSTYSQPRAFGAVVDASNTEALTEWVNKCAERSGRIDVVIPNVSAFHTADKRDHWQTTFQTDLMSSFTMIETALPYLEKTKGNIVTIASVTARDIDFTSPGPYGPMKAALVHYTQSLGHQLGPKGIRANSCSPGNIYVEDGPFGEIKREAPELFKSQLAKNPLGRYGRAEEIADAVLFLASERASFVSGSNFVVDGALCTGIQL